MHDSPQYALLQSIQHLHAECKQRAQSLEMLASSTALPTDVQDKLMLALSRIERLFKSLEKNAILDTCEIRTFTSRGLKRSVRGQYDWINDALVELSIALQNGTLSSEMCDVLLSRLEQAQRAGSLGDAHTDR